MRLLVIASSRVGEGGTSTTVIDGALNAATGSTSWTLTSSSRKLIAKAKAKDLIIVSAFLHEEIVTVSIQVGVVSWYDKNMTVVRHGSWWRWMEVGGRWMKTIDENEVAAAAGRASC